MVITEEQALLEYMGARGSFSHFPNGLESAQGKIQATKPLLITGPANCAIESDHLVVLMGHLARGMKIVGKGAVVVAGHARTEHISMGSVKILRHDDPTSADAYADVMAALPKNIPPALTALFNDLAPRGSVLYQPIRKDPSKTIEIYGSGAHATIVADDMRDSDFITGDGPVMLLGDFLKGSIRTRGPVIITGKRAQAAFISVATGQPIITLNFEQPRSAEAVEAAREKFAALLASATP